MKQAEYFTNMVSQFLNWPLTIIATAPATLKIDKFGRDAYRAINFRRYYTLSDALTGKALNEHGI